MSNVAPLSHDKRVSLLCALIRDARAVSGLGNEGFARWLRAIADEIEASQ